MTTDTIDDHIKEEPAQKPVPVNARDVKIFMQPYLHAKEAKLCPELEYVGVLWSESTETLRTGYPYQRTGSTHLFSMCESLRNRAASQGITHVFHVQVDTIIIGIDPVRTTPFELRGSLLCGEGYRLTDMMPDVPGVGK